MFKLKLQITMTLLGATLYSAPCLSEPSLDDPMRPPAEVATDTSSGKVNKGNKPKGGQGYTLSAIRIGQQQRSATINGKSVTIGERIGRASVVAIRANGVTLKQNGKAITLPLLPVSIKSPVEAKRP